MVKDNLDKTLSSISKKKVTEKPSVMSKEDSIVLYGKTIRVLDMYLPNILVKLGYFPDNISARAYVRTNGIILNGKLTHSCDSVNYSENCEIEYNGEKVQVFKVS